jgi:hypothetical protein
MGWSCGIDRYYLSIRELALLAIPGRGKYHPLRPAPTGHARESYRQMEPLGVVMSALVVHFAKELTPHRIGRCSECRHLRGR